MDKSTFEKLEKEIDAEAEAFAQKFEAVADQASSVVAEVGMSAMLSMFQGLNKVLDELLTPVKSEEAAKPQETGTDE